jgi:hypothetical protein
MALACAAVGGSLTGETQRREEVAKLARLQTELMRFGDDYIAELVSAMKKVERGTREEDLLVITMVLNQATAVLDIAAGPNPRVNLADMAVFVSLSRWAAESYWVPEVYGERLRSLPITLRGLEQRAWAIAAKELTPQQLKQLRDGIDAWRAQHPDVHDPSFIRLDDIARVVPGQAEPEPGSTSLLGALGLDPFSGIDPAVAQVQQTRIVAERAIYYAKHSPRLLDLQLQHLLLEIGGQPQPREVIEAMNRASRAMEVFGRTAQNLPELVAREREAAIRQVLDTLKGQEGQARALLDEARSTLEAGKTTATSVEALVHAVDSLAARFEKPGQPDGAPSKPFDIDDYTRALQQLATASLALDSLLASVDRDTPKLEALLRQATAQESAVVDHAFRLALILVGVVLAAAIAYRLVAVHIVRGGGVPARAERPS